MAVRRGRRRPVEYPGRRPVWRRKGRSGSLLARHLVCSGLQMVKTECALKIRGAQDGGPAKFPARLGKNSGLVSKVCPTPHPERCRESGKAQRVGWRPIPEAAGRHTSFSSRHPFEARFRHRRKEPERRFGRCPSSAPPMETPPLRDLRSRNPCSARALRRTAGRQMRNSAPAPRNGN